MTCSHLWLDPLKIEPLFIRLYPMKSSHQDLPKSRIRLTITLSASELEQYVTHALDELGRQVSISGFRPGKAPHVLLRERIGEERMMSHALEEAIQESYKKTLIERDLIPVSEPTIKVENFGETEGLSYTAEVDRVPDVKLGDYRRVKVDEKKFAPSTITKADIDGFMRQLKRRHATLTPVDRAAQTGDVVELKYRGTIDGVARENLTNQHHPAILGEDVFLPDFEAQILGMKQGEEKVFTIEVPVDSKKKKEMVEFTVTLLNLSEVVLPSDDELAKSVGKAAFDEVTKMAEEFLTDQASKESAQAYETAVIEAVTKKVKVEVPESLIDREVHHRLHNLEHQIKEAGQTLSSWLKSQKKTVEEISKDMRPAAETAVKSGLVLRAIAEAEEIIQPGASVTDEALSETVARLVGCARAKKN